MDLPKSGTKRPHYEEGSGTSRRLTTATATPERGSGARLCLAIVTLLLACVLMAGAVSATSWTDADNFNESWYETYTSGDTFLIYDSPSFSAFSEKVSQNTTPSDFSGKTVKLMADIDLSEHNWTAIGTQANSFNGTFDGTDHTISNMKIEGNVAKGGGDVYYGLFGYVVGDSTNVYQQMSEIYDVDTETYKATDASDKYTAKVGNFKLANPVITTNGSWVGAAVGGAKYAYIHDISVGTSASNGGTITGANSVGGVIGRGYNSFVERCTNYATVTSGENTIATYNAGGIAGSMRYEDKDDKTKKYCSAIVDSKNHGTVTYQLTTGGAAGICGQTDSNLVVYGCENHGAITCTATTVQAANPETLSISGILGVTNAANVIANSKNTAAIKNSGDTAIGSINGIYGRPNGQSYVINCENSGELRGNAVYMGGVTAYVANAGADPQLTIRATTVSGTVTNGYASGMTSTYVAICTNAQNGGILIENVRISDSDAFTHALVQEGRMTLKNVIVSSPESTVSLPFTRSRTIVEDAGCSLPKIYRVDVTNVPAAATLNLTLPKSAIQLTGTNTSSTKTPITLLGEGMTVTTDADAPLSITVRDAKNSQITNSGKCNQISITASENIAVTNSGTIDRGLSIISSKGATVTTTNAVAPLNITVRESKNSQITNSGACDKIVISDSENIAVTNSGTINEGLTITSSKGATIYNTKTGKIIGSLHAVSLASGPSSGSDDVAIHNKGSIYSGPSGGSNYILYAPDFSTFTLLNYDEAKLVSRTNCYYITYGSKDGGIADVFSFKNGVYTGEIGSEVVSTEIEPGRDVYGKFLTSNSGNSATVNTYNASNITHIIITTPPAKTTYTEGQIFDPTGMVVEAAYNNTIDPERKISLKQRWLFYPTMPLSTSMTELTVSFMGITTTTPITVNPKPQPDYGSSSSGNSENSFRVIFSTDGSNAGTVVAGLSYGDRVTKPADPTKNGYTFGGWYRNTAYTIPWDFAVDAVPGDTVLYAKWISGNAVVTATATPTNAATASATEAATAAATTVQSGTAPTMTQAPAPVFGLLAGLLVAGVLRRKK